MTDAYKNSLSSLDIEVGSTGPEVVVEDLERQDFVQYAGASGDFNPVHYNEPYARAQGNPSVFGQGMFTAGVAAHMVADWFGLNNIQAFKTRFTARVWPGDTISATGEVVEVDPTEDGAEVTAEFTVTNEEGDCVLTGSVTATVSSE